MPEVKKLDDLEKDIIKFMHIFQHEDKLNYNLMKDIMLRTMILIKDNKKSISNNIYALPNSKK